MAFQTKAILQLYTQDPTVPGFTSTSFSGPYVITDHNRKDFDINYERIEKSDRMADGTLRRFITANKKKISTSWTDLPAAGGVNFTADGNLGGAFLKSFYEENVYQPVWIKMTYAEEAWRFANTTDTFSIKQGQSTNKTLLRSAQNLSVASAYYISSASISSISSGAGTASITTSVPPSGITNGVYINVSGIDSFLNGTFLIKAVSGNVISYDLSKPMFVINSYTQSNTSITLNVDMTYWIATGDKIRIYNSINTTGSSVNGDNDWTVTAKTDNTITASYSGLSQTGAGRNGIAILQTKTNSASKTFGNTYIAAFAPAVSPDIIKCFITNFNYNITKRLAWTDYVNVDIEFTEI